MRSLHIACAQFAASPGDKDANLRAIERLTAEAAARGCALVVFPEMALTGYLPPEQMGVLAEAADGDSARRIADIAARHGIAVAYGFPELVEGQEKKANTFLVVGRDGSRVGRYRKVHLWDTEAAWCDPGTEVPVFAYEGTMLSGWICYDTRFPELARLEYLAGAEVCLVPTAWLGPAEEWELALRSRALDNTFFVAGADLINPLSGLRCRGSSMIAGPHGEILARAEPETEGVIDAVLDPELMRAQRARVPLLRDRRPSFYGGLVAGR
jgi:5-aminopentanamidase